MSAEIQERICKIIAEQLSQDIEEVVPEASFIDDLGADSLDLVELVMHMEEEFDVEIPDEEDIEDSSDVTEDQSTASGRLASLRDEMMGDDAPVDTRPISDRMADFFKD